MTTETKSRREHRAARPRPAGTSPSKVSEAAAAPAAGDAQRIADEVLAHEPVAEGDFPEAAAPAPPSSPPTASSSSSARAEAGGDKGRVREPGESLIQVSLGEPEAGDPAAREDPLHTPVETVPLREHEPDIDLGERRRRPRPAREPIIAEPFPNFDEDESALAPRAMDPAELVIDEADEKAIHEQSMAFDRPATDDRTADLRASSLKSDRTIVYRDLGGQELDVTAVPEAEETVGENSDRGRDAVASVSSAGSYGLLKRAYDRIARAFRTVSSWFGIRDERKDR